MLEGHAIKSKLSTSVLYAVLALSMSACTMGHTPEPYLPLRSSLVAGETVTVKNNENIYAVARAHNVSMRDIIVLNNLKPPFALKGGQQLVMPINTTALASGVTKETSAVLPGSSI